MESKTPQFDKLLDEILDTLVPHSRECKWKGKHPYCEGEFEITNEDIEFLKILRVPAPICCPTCRKIQRRAFVNTAVLYKHINNAPGNSNSIVSFVPPASPLIVYDVASYLNIFEPYNYGVIYDESRSFVDQFYDLRLSVPQPAVIRDPSNINSEYSINGRNSKNCYWVSGAWSSEDIWYSNLLHQSKEIMDSVRIDKSERCYECVSSKSLYNSQYLYYSENCINSYLLFDCRNCQDCFGCVNLRNKRYCWFNKQLSKEEYEIELSSANFQSRKLCQTWLDKFWSFVRTQPIRAARIEQSENVTGVDILNCKNCHDVIHCERSEHGRHLDSVMGNKDSMDAHGSGSSEKLYGTSAVGSQCSNVKFSFASKFITDSEFLINCRNCSNCFACIGLQNKSYSIFNKQYEPNQYFEELDRIKSSMMSKGEYGEFLPYNFSTFAYNGSSADIPFPLTEEQVKELGALWQPEIEIDIVVNMTILKSDDVPDTISEVTDEILNQAIICEETGRLFRIITTELEFYRKHHIPLPTIHPYLRIRSKLKKLGNVMVNRTICSSCKKEIDSMYGPEGNFILYCEDCYKLEVY